MRAIRVLKKAQRSLESIDSHSRQIISSIYEKQLTEGDSMLQFQKFSNKWSVGMKSTALSTSQPLLQLETPLENYLPLLSLIANSSLIESESMVILDKKVAFIVYYQRVLFVQKNRNDKKTIRSWLNQLYSLKLRKSGSLHLSNDIGKRQIIHNCEQKQYMPSLINGKQKLTRFISNIKLSSEAFYGKNGQLQKEPFCVCLFKNGDKQIFSYSQIVSFIQYPFNLQEILYFKILCQPKDEVVSLNALYSHSLETIDQRAQIQKYKRILQKTDRWAYLKDSWQQLKDKYSKQQKYQHYSELLTLQIVAFLEFKHMIKVKKLALQWKMDSKNNFILSNCHQYESFQQKNDLPINQELFFLYQQRVSRSLVSQRHQKESTQQSRKNSSCMAEITKDINQSKNMRIKIKSRKIVHRPSTLSLDKSSNISLISTKRRKIWV